MSAHYRIVDCCKQDDGTKKDDSLLSVSTTLVCESAPLTQFISAGVGWLKAGKLKASRQRAVAIIILKSRLTQ
jgi:hypothetical protein